MISELQSKYTNKAWINSELSARFERKPRKCMKKNDSLIGFTARIIQVYNNSFVYDQSIQQFTDKDEERMRSSTPTAGVKLTDIQSLKYPSKSLKQKNYFTIVFPFNKLIKYQKGDKQVFVDSSAAGKISWTFQFGYDIILLPQKQQRSLLKRQLYSQQ